MGVIWAQPKNPANAPRTLADQRIDKTLADRARKAAVTLCRQYYLSESSDRVVGGRALCPAQAGL